MYLILLIYLYPFVENKGLDDLVITAANFIQEKKGKITLEYNLLGPPLGKGG